MFIFIDNAQLTKEIKKTLIDCDLSQAEIAGKLGVTRQSIQKTFNKKQLSFEDVKKLLDVAGYDIGIEFIRRPQDEPNVEKTGVG